MTHDPLCPFHPWPEEHCYQQDAGVSICALIAVVREDEHIRTLDFAQQGNTVMHVQGTYFGQGVEAMRQACIAAVEQALADGLATSSDGALYFFELDEDDPTSGHDVTFHKESLVTVLREVTP